MIETTKGWDLQLLLAEDVRIIFLWALDQTLRTLWKTIQKETSEKKQHRSEIQWARQAEICSTLTSMCSPAHLAKDTVRKQGNMTNRTYNKTWTHTSTLCEDLKHDAWRKPKRHKDSQGIQGHGISGITLYELITGWGVAQRFQDSESLHMQNN